ncbi:MAG: hypothetical protein ACP5QO_07475, partial [Clostridia bacterium]
QREQPRWTPGSGVGGRALLTAGEWGGWLTPIAGLVVVAPFVGPKGFLAAWWTRATGLGLALLAIRVGWRWIATRARKESGS